ncbi:hypothetical protein WJX73_003629 [Symbiochloris irregularis]|uniref:General transcription and DNA repair factor IIH subunit TFB4 n=1 Tax=Symbiochloris irregularis TaxID=706552 RepID=A0AAW1P3S2_9CHLO
MSEDSSSSLMVVLLETHSSMWIQADSQPADQRHLSAAGLLEQAVGFLNAFLLLSDANQLAVFCIHASTSHLLHLSPGLLQTRAKDKALMQDTLGLEIIARIQDIMQQPETDMGGRPALAGALSRALCFIRGQWGGSAEEGQRLKALGRAPPRLLTIASSQDAPQQYIPTMNAIFAAQKLGVVMDTCMAGPHESAYLQQAAHITGGQYLRPSKPGALLQYLLTLYLADTNTRKLLKYPPSPGIDFSASCFCHKNPIDMGFVCSVCLSIFCENVKECSTCGTKFDLL